MTSAAFPPSERSGETGYSSTAYIWYLLRYRVVEILERKRAAEDLRELATGRWPAFAAVVYGDEQLIEDILRSVFKLAPVQDEITGAKPIVLGSVTLAVFEPSDAEVSYL